MGFLGAVRAGVKVANKLTRSLQAEVTLEHYVGQDKYGTRTFSVPHKLLAIVDWKTHQVRTAQGINAMSRSSVLFLDPLALAAATNGEGVDDKDRITLPDGTSGPILDMSGFIDAGTKQPIATEVFLG